MRKGIVIFFLLASCFFGSGCNVSVGVSADSHEFYVLMPNAKHKLEGKFTQLDARLIIRETGASRFYSGRKIVFSQDAATRGYYQQSSWVESTPRRFSFLLLERFKVSGLFKSVSRQSSAATGDFQLNTEIVDFYHDISDKPGRVKVTVLAELLDFRKRIVISTKAFTRTYKSSEYNVRGAVEGFSKAADEILGEIVFWTDEALSIYRKKRVVVEPS